MKNTSALPPLKPLHELPKTSQVKNSLTSIRDIDLKILSELNDRDLFQFCLVNKNANELCRNEHFWRNRFVNRFGSEAAKYKPTQRIWRNHYLSVVSNLDKYSEDPWKFFDEISWNMHDENIDNLVKNKDESFHDNFWMLNLGKEAYIKFPIDYQDFGEIDRKYSSSTYLTPYQILKHIYEFYQEPITIEELEEQQEEDNPYAEDFDESDIVKKKVLRIDMLGNPFFEGFWEDDGGFLLNFGS